MPQTSYPKLDRIIHRERKIQKALQKEDLGEQKHKYFIMEIPIEKVPEAIQMFEKKSSSSNRLAFNAVNVRQYNNQDPKDNELFTEIFNLVLLTFSKIKIRDKSRHLLKILEHLNILISDFRVKVSAPAYPHFKRKLF